MQNSKYNFEQVEAKLDLLEEENFKAYLKAVGVEGDSGNASIDDDTVSNNSTWSSSKISSEVEALIQSAIGEAMGGDY